MDSLESMPTFMEHNPPAAPETTFTTLTAERTEEVLRKLNPFKAPGQSNIPNTVLKHCMEQLSPILAKIYTAICQLNYHPLRFCSINQVVICKPGRPLYKEANAY
jgi:hypothetical protein